MNAYYFVLSQMAEIAIMSIHIFSGKGLCNLGGLVTMRSIIVLAILIASTIQTVWALEPPRGLRWGMTKSEIFDVFASDPDKPSMQSQDQKKPKRGYREYPELWLPDGYWRAEVKNIKINGKKTERTYLILDTAQHLVALNYIFTFDNDQEGLSKNKGMRKCWVFHSDIKASLENKYGKPETDESWEIVRDREIASGSKYSSIWTDSSGSEIRLLITRQVHNMIIANVDTYLVIITYSCPGYEIPLAHNDQTDEGDL